MNLFPAGKSGKGGTLCPFRTWFDRIFPLNNAGNNNTKRDGLFLQLSYRLKGSLLGKSQWGLMHSINESGLRRGDLCQIFQQHSNAVSCQKEYSAEKRD
ncbi:MAG: hypothetical protein WCP08_01255 [Prolixibacteraceae bacterium]